MSRVNVSRNIHIIIVAAGSGSRFGSALPKQFCELDGRPVLMHTIDAFRTALPESSIAVVISQDMKDLWLQLCELHSFDSPRIVFGGPTRWASVANALAGPACPCDSRSIIMVHDGARPLIDGTTLRRICEGFDATADGVLPTVALSDSVRQIDADGRSHALDRSSLRAVQTPQAFRADKLHDAYRQPYRPTFTDDASVMESAGYTSLRLVEGSTENIKITNPDDIAIASLILSHRDR